MNSRKRMVKAMAKIAKQLTELIGNTPLLELTNYEKENELEANLIVKLEYFNPLGSVKDRVAYAMIEQGIADGKINSDTVIIEPTSGNTGIGLAFVTEDAYENLKDNENSIQSEEYIYAYRLNGAMTQKQLKNKLKKIYAERGN